MTKDAVSGRRRHLILPLFLLILILATISAWAARRPILRKTAALWVISDPLSPADAIAVLGGGLYLRPFFAAELYRKGLAGTILVANVKPSPLEKLGIERPHAEVARQTLRQLGVPAEAIIGFGTDVSNTFDESRALADWAKNNGVRTIIVPTEFFPSRRQRWILNHELNPVGARAIVPALKPLDYGIDDWWQHEAGLIEFQNEVIKYLYYRVKY